MESPPLKKRYAVALFVVPAVLIVVLDLWSKDAVFELLNVKEEIFTTADSPRPRPAVVFQDRIVVIEDFFWLEANYNYGAFSGWFSERTGILATFSVVAALAMVGFFVYSLKQRPERVFSLSLGLLLGGAVGNLYDRAALNGVRDWIRWFVVIDGQQHVWPNFNIADSAICTGVGLLFLREFVRWRGEVRERRVETEREAA